MREFKFRAWDGISNVMWEDVHFDKAHIYLSEWDNEKQTWKGCMPRWETNPIMQFTGLKDKNGVEIYEGDIIRNWFYSMDGMDLGHKWIVKFGEYDDSDIDYGSPGIGFYVETKLEAASLLNIAGEEEVIGNIYENKELLCE